MAQVKTLNINGSDVADFIIEQGTETVTCKGDMYSSSGRVTTGTGTTTWFWEKWNSGIAKCWGEFTVTDTTTANQYNALKAPLPRGLFKSRLMGLCSMSDWTIDSTYDNTRDNLLTEFQLVYWAARASTSTRKFTVYIYGTWK